jgi:hypothetical protein
MKSFSKPFALLALSAASLGVFGFTAVSSNPESPSEIRQENPRGTIDRNGVKYKWELEKKNGTTFQLKIVKEFKGQSNLVYSTDVVHEGSNFKLYLAKQNGYKWDIDRSSFISVTYGSTGVTMAVEGNMKNMVETNIGISEADLKKKNAPDKNTLYALCKYATTQLVFKYKKALKP